MLTHSYVPKSLKLGFMLPLIKDSRGLIIALLRFRLSYRRFSNTASNSFSLSISQFGFKRNSSTVDALFCLKHTINLYTENKSRVHCSFLDASKAFDRLVHTGLYLKLIQRNVPKVLLDIIISMHTGLFCRVRWEGCFSSWFPLHAGVRQGGVISPDLYCIYVDSLISILQ